MIMWLCVSRTEVPAPTTATLPAGIALGVVPDGDKFPLDLALAGVPDGDALPLLDPYAEVFHPPPLFSGLPPFPLC